jgi:hypothetical protein
MPQHQAKIAAMRTNRFTPLLLSPGESLAKICTPLLPTRWQNLESAENSPIVQICGGSVIARLTAALQRKLLPTCATIGLFQNPDRLTESVRLPILLLQTADNFIH